MNKSTSEEKILFPSPPHSSALVAFTPAPLTIFAYQSHIILPSLHHLHQGALIAHVEWKLQTHSRLQVPLNLSPSMERKIEFFNHALLICSLTQTLLIYIQIQIWREAPVPFPSSSRCSRCSSLMPAPLWPRLTRLQRISHLHLHLCWPGSHHFTHFPKYHNYMCPVIWNKCWQTCQSNNHASKQGQVQISTDYSQRTVGFQLNRSTGPQLSISIGHSSQLSLLPYQTWRSYYEMTLIVVSNLPHLFTSGRWHWGSRGRRKERIGRKFVPKATWQYKNRQKLAVGCTDR